MTTCFNFRIFFRLFYLSFFRWKDIPCRLTFKRILFLAGFFTIFPVFQLFNAACFLMDNIFFHEYKNVEIKTPVFIVGNPRSGTTLIHRAMAKDEERFFCFKTWEIIFPAIIQKKVLYFIGSIDRFMGSPFGSYIKRIESRLFNEYNKIHQVGFFSPEEDDKLLLHIFSSLDLVWFFPFEEADNFARFDQLVSPEDRKRTMTFYKDCIKRQAYCKGSKKCFLSKAPGSSAKIGSLYEYFPGCKIVYMVRNPLEVVPSMINMTDHIWRSTVNLESGYPLQDQTYETARFFYKYPLARFEDAPPGSNIIVNYEDLISAPGRTIQAVYQKSGLEITQKYQKILDQEEKKAGAYKSGHLYSLEQLHITREQIVSDLQDVFDRFGFDTGEEKKDGSCN